MYCTITVDCVSSQNMHYRVNLETQACVKSPIGVPFRPIGVPPAAEFRGYAYIGSSQNDHAGIKVQNWYNRSDTGMRRGLQLCINAKWPFIRCLSVSVLQENCFIDKGLWVIRKTMHGTFVW